MKKERRDSRCSRPCIASQADFLLARHGIQALTASAWDARPCCYHFTYRLSRRFLKKKKNKTARGRKFLTVFVVVKVV